MAEALENTITVTEEAATRITALIEDQSGPEQKSLRIAVRGGGCSGFQYALSFDTRADDDLVFEDRGVAVLVDEVSLKYVAGSEVDYLDALTGAGFQVNNPNVVASCGCGTSFQVKEEDADAAVV